MDECTFCPIAAGVDADLAALQPNACSSAQANIRTNTAHVTSGSKRET
jgi:hypothetical protein